MREAAFIKQNKDKWAKFENVIFNNVDISPDQLSALYVEVSDNLSYAQTFYPESKTAKYLNMLSTQAHQKIYKTKKESRSRIITYFTKEFPLFFYQYQKQLLISFLTFLLFVGVGAFSASTDKTFSRMIMGDAYIDMTLENMQNGDPMAVYKKGAEMDMFLGITLNNIKVALRTFVFGLLLGVGTLYSLMRNGIMLGTFQYFLFDHGYFWESVRTIWIHGTIEISAIIVAGCAGLVVGKSILFPATYTRLKSFTKGVKSGLKIVISTVPFFIIAGFMESFVTRHTEMPDWVAIAIITLSLLLIVFYYVIYPQHLFRKQKNYGKPALYKL